MNRVSSTEYVEQALGRRDFQAIVVTQSTTTADPALLLALPLQPDRAGTERRRLGVRSAPTRRWTRRRREQSIDGREHAPTLSFEAAFAEDCPAVPLYRPMMHYAMWDGLLGRRHPARHEPERPACRRRTAGTCSRDARRRWSSARALRFAATPARSHSTQALKPFASPARNWQNDRARVHPASVRDHPVEVAVDVGQQVDLVDDHRGGAAERRRIL